MMILYYSIPMGVNLTIFISLNKWLGLISEDQLISVSSKELLGSCISKQ